MPQPLMPDTAQDDDGFAFPGRGDIITVHNDEESLVFQIVKDHGPARIYTVKGSDDVERLVALDGDGLSWNIGDDDAEDA